MLLKNLESIVILVTMKCNCNCAHCFYFPRTDNHYPIDPDMVEDCLKSIEGHHNVKTIHFTGGEPFYYYETLLSCIERYRKLGFKSFSVSTNAGWADSLSLAQERVRQLRELGVSGIQTSADAFHQKAVPLERVLNVLKAGNTGMETGRYDPSTCVESTYLGYRTYDCPVNRENDEIIRKIWDAGFYVQTNVTTAHGRSSFLIPHELHINKRLDRKCWDFVLGVLHPEGPIAVLIDPDGYVDGCFGVPLGNLYRESMLSIFQRYFTNPGPIISTLHREGSLGLKRLAVERGFRPADSYYDECHLCHKARNYLKEHCVDEFGEFLNPPACYPSIVDDNEHPFEDWSPVETEKQSQTSLSLKCFLSTRM